MKRIVCIKPEETISINKINDDSGCDYMTIISYKHGKPSGMISKYKGKYIATVDSEILSSSISLKTTYEEAMKKNPKKTPYIQKIYGSGPLLL